MEKKTEMSEAFVRSCFMKRIFFKISQKLRETPALESLFKRRRPGLQLYQRRDFSTGAFL